MDGADGLPQRWNFLHRDYLPSLAQARDPVQEKWPVVLDHCFARIILDNAVGKDRRWSEVVKQPAVKNMSDDQLGAAIELAEEIATGRRSIVRLNERSLEFRGKRRRKADVDSNDASASKRRKKDGSVISSYFLPAREDAEPEANGLETKDAAAEPKAEQFADDLAQDSRSSIEIQLKRIADSNITPFRKLTLSLLCQVPRGSYSTYQAMSDHITRKSHKTCARAVGNAMRNNPFAPDVPCHRILAADGSLGGFKGHWGEQGRFADQKHRLLHEEGVRFDSRGRVKGPPFRGFTL